jgi:uncharacterized protein YfaS (alpha-2-macroglobulin family)
MVTVSHVFGSTPRFDSGQMVDYDGSNMDPDSQSIIIYDPLGNLMTTITNPVKDSVGNYHFYYTIPANGPAGTWVMYWTVVKSSLPSRTRTEFVVSG